MKEALKFYKDFPKEGIVFVDISPLLQDKKIFAEVIEKLGSMLSAPNIAAPEARGFLFAAPLLTSKPEVESIILEESIDLRRSYIASASNCPQPSLKIV